jgi:hypothetical protein
MDLTYYYSDPAAAAATAVTVTPPDLSGYTPLSIHNSAAAELDARLDALEARGTQDSETIIEITNNIGKLTKKESDGWYDIAKPFFDFAGNAAGELADEFLRWWLDKSGPKEWLTDFARDLISPGAVDLDGDGDGVIDQPQVTVSFRTLVRNPFAVSRSPNTDQMFGVGVASDLNLAPGASINRVFNTDMVPGVFGNMWSVLMDNSHKAKILEVSTLTAWLNKLVLASELQSPMVACTDLVCTDASIDTASVSALACESCSVAGKAPVLTDTQAQVTSVSVNEGSCTLQPDGTAEVFQLVVNGGSLWVMPSGDVYCGNRLVISSSTRAPVVFDDEIQPRANRYNLNNVLSGNLGSSDTRLFDGGAPLYARASVDNPLSFTQLANGAAFRAMQGYSAGDWWNI